MNTTDTKPVDDRFEIVRWDLVNSARRFTGLRLLVRAIETATTSEEWVTVAHDLDTMRGRTSNSHGRGVLAAAAEAAEALADGLDDAAIESALTKLADPCGLTIEGWLTETRRERAKEAAEATAPQAVAS